MTEPQLKKVTSILDDFGWVLTYEKFYGLYFSLDMNEINFFAAAVKTIKSDTIDAMNVICEVSFTFLLSISSKTQLFPA